MERVLGVGVSCVFGQELEAVTCAVLRPQRELALQCAMAIVALVVEGSTHERWNTFCW